ncbi:hypothetical protein EST38_g13718 [Candolleomyces aberdarensis]|uniref:Uncharacterized protein n=1 Tax=Candolleomyces aberdarensis TaxID=2316362 RepID=A0A4V1Q1M8_9AGAR|nr:hypothetical protein EST38_g13718 [Candolleomyces aberdarensis]
MAPSYNFPSPGRRSDMDSPMLTPSPRSRPPFPALAFSNDFEEIFRSPFKSPAQAQPYSSTYSISKPQPITADDEEGRVFASSNPSTLFPQLFSPQPLLTPAKPNATRTALSIKNMNQLSEVAADHKPLATRVGMKRKSNVHCTPLKVEGAEFQRLGPLPLPKTPVSKADPDVALGHHTTTLRKLRLADRMDVLDDSGCEMDDDDAEAVLLQKNRSSVVAVAKLVPTEIFMGT